VGALSRKYRLSRQRIHQIVTEADPDTAPQNVKPLALPA
jgi:Mor family transcriptional regulator